jgi:Fic family protein
MRTPKKPPESPGVFDDPGDFQSISRILGAVDGPTVNGKYVHWDTLIRLSPPSQLDHAKWWRGLKFRRRNAYRHVPLRDKKGDPFLYLLTDPIPERLHRIDLGAGGHIQMPDQITNPETKDRYYVGSLIAEAITSSQLEGAATTRQVAKEMIRSGRAPRDRSERMILNNYRAMQRIGRLKEKEVTPQLVFEIHRLVTSETLDNPEAGGRLRRADERVAVGDLYGEVFHNPPPADELEERMKAMCDFANGKTPGGFLHPAIRSIILHFWLAYDHPFVDGNGRTARALFYWSMLHHGFWLFEFISISQIILKAPMKYCRAFLYTETDENDLTYFILYHLEVIRRAIAELHEYIKRKARELQTLEAELSGISVLNHRQRALVSHALRHPHHRYTIESHRASHNVVYQTARTDLLDLRDRHLLGAKKIGKTWHFVPVDDLGKKLSKLT